MAHLVAENKIHLGEYNKFQSNVKLHGPNIPNQLGRNTSVVLLYGRDLNLSTETILDKIRHCGYTCYHQELFQYNTSSHQIGRVCMHHGRIVWIQMQGDWCLTCGKDYCNLWNAAICDLLNPKSILSHISISVIAAAGQA